MPRTKFILASLSGNELLQHAKWYTESLEKWKK